MGIIIQNGKQYCPVYGLPDDSIKALPTVSTASGSVATFDTDMTENLIEVKCEIVYQQGGSGTPSPDNVRPITTYSEMNVLHSGINLFDESTYVIGHSYIDISNLKIGATYTILAKNTSALALFKIAASSGSTPLWQSLSLSGATFTVTQAILDIGKLWIINSFYQTATVEDIQTAKISLNYPSTDTEYHAYNGNTYNILFGQTAAKGTLNVTTGKLRVTWVTYDMSTLNWENQFLAEGTIGFCVNNLGVKLPPDNATKFDGLCEVYTADTIVNVYAKTNDKIIGCYSTIDRIVVYDSDYTNYTDFKNSVVGKKLIFELNSPLEIQLSSTQITTLLNENNIWCDTGDTEVKYLLTVGKKIG